MRQARAAARERGQGEAFAESGEQYRVAALAGDPPKAIQAPAVGDKDNLIMTSGGTISYAADQLAGPLGNTTLYLSALLGGDSGNSALGNTWAVVTFGMDSSLTVGPGWDNVTGLAPPNGTAFVNTIAR